MRALSEIVAEVNADGADEYLSVVELIEWAQTVEARVRGINALSDIDDGSLVVGDVLDLRTEHDQHGLPAGA